MPKYQPKTKSVEAWQLPDEGANLDDTTSVPSWVMQAVLHGRLVFAGNTAYTRNGDNQSFPIAAASYIVQDGDELYGVDAKRFEADYELVN